MTENTDIMENVSASLAKGNWRTHCGEWKKKKTEVNGKNTVTTKMRESCYQTLLPVTSHRISYRNSESEIGTLVLALPLQSYGTLEHLLYLSDLLTYHKMGTQTKESTWTLWSLCWLSKNQGVWESRLD